MITEVVIYDNPTYVYVAAGGKHKGHIHEKQARLTVVWHPIDKLADGTYTLSGDPKRKTVERHIYVSLERGIQAINKTA